MADEIPDPGEPWVFPPGSVEFLGSQLLGKDGRPIDFPALQWEECGGIEYHFRWMPAIERACLVLPDTVVEGRLKQ